MKPYDPRPVVAHVMYRFAIGGMENGIVNLINRMPGDAYRHAVVALTEVTDFRRRIERDDVSYVSLNKPPGHGFQIYPQMYHAFRELRPAIVHTRNLAALEAAVPAWFAEVPVRIHGEHGRDVDDPDGRAAKHRWIRRAYRPFVDHYIAMSRDLEEYLVKRVGFGRRHVTQIYNGVDAERFRPSGIGRHPVCGSPFNDCALWVVGTVGRMQAIKDQLGLTRAFIRAVQADDHARSRVRLILVGDGPLREQCAAELSAAGMADLAWLPGERDDVADLMRTLSCFVLPSLGEGISNTILEAMASALPVIATRVGGNSELVQEGQTGMLVPAADPEAMARAILYYFRDPAAAASQGAAARLQVEQRFSLDTMAAAYMAVYDRSLGIRRGSASLPATPNAV